VILFVVAWIINGASAALAFFESKSITYLSAADAAKKGGKGMMFDVL
jgi:hypothetical protein